MLPITCLVPSTIRQRKVKHMATLPSLSRLKPRPTLAPKHLRLLHPSHQRLLSASQIPQNQLQLDRPPIHLHGRPVLPVQREPAFSRTAQSPLTVVVGMLLLARRPQSY